MEELPFEYKLKDGRACFVRAIAEEDAEAFLSFFPPRLSESDFLNYMPGEFSKTLEEERKFIRDHMARPGSTALVAFVEGELVATAGAESKPLKRYAHQTELGLVVAEPYWQQGIGRKLMEWLIDWSGAEGLKKVTLRVFADNANALELYRSLGFVEEARLQGDALKADGTYRDTILMALVLDQARP
jgi:RimJ/RimL family protein N-acetyltransferase